MLLYFYLMLVVAYLFGSLNSAILTCKFLGLPSPRTIGSGNPGTTNVLRLGGKKAAIITLLGDAVKGLIPVVIAHFFDLTHLQIGYVALAAVIGHIFPLFFGFKGGKGVATLIGVLIGFYWLAGVVFLLVWLVLAVVTRYSSLSALLATIISMFFILYFFNINTATPFIILTIMIVIRHHENIKRLLSGKESRIGDNKKQKT